jgi:hypothetical protein
VLPTLFAPLANAPPRPHCHQCSARRRGYVIARLTLRDVNEIFDIRSLIEPGDR